MNSRCFPPSVLEGCSAIVFHIKNKKYTLKAYFRYHSFYTLQKTAFIYSKQLVTRQCGLSVNQSLVQNGVVEIVEIQVEVSHLISSSHFRFYKYRQDQLPYKPQQKFLNIVLPWHFQTYIFWVDMNQIQSNSKLLLDYLAQWF